MAQQYTVQDGDTLVGIASEFGFADYRAIYNHARNAFFRQQRPNPNLIFPGDELYIPDRRLDPESVQTDAVHRFVLGMPRKLLVIVLENDADEPIANTSYELTVGSQTYRGTTDSTGRLEHAIPATARRGTLCAQLLQWELAIGSLNPIQDTPDAGVSGIQARLKNLGFYLGEVTGQLNQNTQAAVESFQRKHPPLKVDGICGPKTSAKLIEVHGS